MMDKALCKKSFYGRKVTAVCSLISQDRFVVQISRYSDKALQIFKTISSKSYDPESRNWSFLIRDYDSLLSKLKTIQAELTVEKIPNFALNCMKVPQNEVVVDYDKLDPVLFSTLLPFQVEGLNFGIDKKGRCFIGDDMGLGKSLQALAIANYYKEDWPLLIVTTSSMKTVWEEMIRNYLPSVPVISIQYMVSGRDYINDSSILIVSHDMVSRALEKLLQKGFGVFIIDESHVLKNCKTQCYKSCLQLSERAKRVILLSGTPALSRPSELYTQLNIIDPEFVSFFQFTKRYCNGKQTKFGWDASGKSNLKELEIILTKKFMIRRTKEEVLKALPNKKQEVIMLNTKLEEFSNTDREYLIALGNIYNSQKKGSDKHAILLTYFSETAKIKIPSVCSYILQVLEIKEKFLVFAYHQAMMNAIEDVTRKKDVKYIRIDGNTSLHQRKYLISKFQLDDSYMCAILSITAVNAGITLTAAKLVLFAELHWNPSIISQAEARAHRIGQDYPVVVRYLIAPDTADDLMWLLLQEKQQTLKQVGLCKESFDGVEVKKQETTIVAGQRDMNISSSSRSTDVRSHFSPTKKRKYSEGDIFNDGLDDVLSKSADLAEADLLNDGMDDLFRDIDF